MLLDKHLRYGSRCDYISEAVDKSSTKKSFCQYRVG
jgi:hypothetical protein